VFFLLSNKQNITTATTKYNSSNFSYKMTIWL